MATSPDTAEPAEGELRPEYDFTSLKGVTRGKYAARYGQHLRVVRLAEDVAASFADDGAVNAALRQYLREHPQDPIAN